MHFQEPEVGQELPMQQSAAHEQADEDVDLRRSVRLNGFRVQTHFTQESDLDSEMAETDSDSESTAFSENSESSSEGTNDEVDLDVEAGEETWQPEWGIARKPNFDETYVAEGGNTKHVMMHEDSPHCHRHYLGEMRFECTHCRALHWDAEKLKSSKANQQIFPLCCRHGAVKYPSTREPMPPELEYLLFSPNSDAKHFREHIRAYNSILQLASSVSDFKDDRNLTGIQTFALHGRVRHRIGHARPNDGRAPQFAQLYCYDTGNELQNRLNTFGGTARAALRADVLASLQHMLHRDNDLVRTFKAAFAGLDENSPQVVLEISTEGDMDIRTHNAPQTETEVAALLLDDDNPNRSSRRAFKVYYRSGERSSWTINETNAIHEPAHFVLTNPRGERGWHDNIQKLIQPGQRNKVTILDYAAHRMAFRDPLPDMPNAARDPLHFSGKLFQEWLADTYAVDEQNKLFWARRNQKVFRRSTEQAVQGAVQNGENLQQVGTRVHLPSSVRGSPRQMMKLYQDAIAIVNHHGPPTYFVTMTCNTQWPEIQDELNKLSPKPQPHDRPDIVARVFKMKLAELTDDVLNKHVLGKVVGCCYTVEFQKRGLPHAHILAIVDRHQVPGSSEEIDAFVCAEIPNRWEYWAHILSYFLLI